MALGIMTAEAHLLDQVAALTVVLTVIGLETALQETGRTSVTAVVKEDTLRETAKTVPRSSGIQYIIYCRFFRFRKMKSSL